MKASRKSPMGSAQIAPRPWTYADLAALPDDQLRHERIDGELFVTPSPAAGHQIILMNLIRLLLPYLDYGRDDRARGRLTAGL